MAGMDAATDEFYERRERMVSELVTQGLLRTEKIIKAFLEVPRHVFGGEQNERFAYGDYPIPIPDSQTVSAPHMVAAMTELLRPERKDKVLEIGSGSGYQAAILSKLVKKVYTTEISPELAAFARSNLKKAGANNVEVMLADGSEGYAKAKPYDKIIVTCATPEIFDAWLAQLKVGGILIAPLGSGFYQELIHIKKTAKGIEKNNYGSVAFVPLRR
ncbi:MAG: protein-L-isoaspartate(D-aspartate) O-methyltransferase [Candidatus Aenigmarchaeota archaeon]|nr:protein-L-isoaspartate(D-aspartate) O-methyltransferase [Candidatus Aenigmarchaeota archaeon]